jgi:hypothetical protein
MNAKGWIAPLLTGLLACAAWAQDAGPAQDAAVPPRGSHIDWNAGQITVVGYAPRQPAAEPGAAKLAQRRAALVDAYRELAETVNGVIVTSSTRVEHQQLVEDTIATHLRALIRNQAVVKEWYEPDGIYAVQLVLPLYGRRGLAGLIYPGLAKREKEIEERRADPAAAPIWRQPPAPELPKAQPQAAPEAPKPPVSTPQNQPGPYTGLVVDCRQMPLERSMSPKIVRGDGTEVWGTMEIDPKVALEKGVAGYLPDLQLALGGHSERAGVNPLIVRATAVDGKFFKTNAVISDNDAELIRAEDAKTHFLGRCAVVFVVDTDR